MSSSYIAENREQLVQRLCKEHGAFILDVLRREGVRGDAANDLAQEVRLILREHIEEERPLPNPRAFLTRAIQYEVKNYQRFEGRRANGGVDVEALPSWWTSWAPNPEDAAQYSEYRAKVVRYLTYLPEHIAAAVLHHYMLEMTLEETATKLGRPIGTVARHCDKGVEMLREFARKSTRETEAGKRIRPNG